MGMSRTDKWKLKRIKRRITLAEVRVNKRLIEAMNNLKHDDKFMSELNNEMNKLNNKEEIKKYIANLVDNQ